jgi:hypothetical protein
MLLLHAETIQHQNAKKRPQSSRARGQFDPTLLLLTIEGVF